MPYTIACVAGGFKGLEIVAPATKTARKNTREQRKIREARRGREKPPAAKPRVNELFAPNNAKSNSVITTIMFDVTRTIKITLKRYHISKRNTNTVRSRPRFLASPVPYLPNFSLPARVFPR